VAALVKLFDAQPGTALFDYGLATLMVEAGMAKLVSTEAGESGPLCTFETVAGDVFTLPKPPLSAEEEAGLREKVRQVLDEEGSEE
jgi:hypothetical protein